MGATEHRITTIQRSRRQKACFASPPGPGSERQAEVGEDLGGAERGDPGDARAVEREDVEREREGRSALVERAYAATATWPLARVGT